MTRTAVLQEISAVNQFTLQREVLFHWRGDGEGGLRKARSEVMQRNEVPMWGQFAAKPVIVPVEKW